ncbi:MAG: PAS domain S-box protein, partial [Thermotogota bacterium]
MGLTDKIRQRINGDITLLNLMNASKKAAFCRDFDGKIVYWNKGAEELYGYTDDEMQGQSVTTIKPANYPTELPFVDERVKQGETIKDLESTRIDKNGHIIIVSSTIIPLEENGKYIAAIHLENNITIKKNESHEKRFRKILESFPDIIFELDKKFNIIWANKAALDIEPLAIGQKCYQAYVGLQKPCDDCAIVNALEKGVTQQSVTHHSAFQNEEKYWENLAIPVKDGYGNISSIIEVSRDITIRKLAERELLQTKERLELAMKAGNVAWWIWDYKSGLVEFDKRKAEMAGYSYEEFPKNVYKITDLIHPDDYKKTMQVMTDHLKGKIPEYRIDYRLKTKQNDYVWFHDRGKVIQREEDGTPLKLSGAVIDITKRKQVEEKLWNTLEKQKRIDESLKIAKEQAEEANRAKSDFL